MSDSNQSTGRIHRHNYEDSFTVMPNHIAEHSKMSWAAKSVIWYLLSRPKDWVVYRAHLAKIYKGEKRGNGKDAIDSIFEELIQLRFIIYTPKDEESGKFIHRYDVYPEEQPEEEDIQKKKPKRVKPATVLPPNGLNTPQQRNDSLLRNEKKKLSVADDPVGSTPYKIIVKGKNKEQDLTKDDVYLFATTKHKEWTIEDIEKSWIVIAEYTGVIHDWKRFIEGTIDNFKKALKSKRAAGNCNTSDSRKKSHKRSMESCKTISQNQKNINSDSLESDTLEQHSPTLVCLGDTMKRLSYG